VKALTITAVPYRINFSRMRVELSSSFSTFDLPSPHLSYSVLLHRSFVFVLRVLHYVKLSYAFLANIRRLTPGFKARAVLALFSLLELDVWLGFGA
jgi:hypothetical protein